MKSVGISIDGIEYGGGVYYTQSLIDIFQKHSAGKYHVYILTSMDEIPLEIYNFNIIKYVKDQSLSGKIYRRLLLAGMSNSIWGSKELYRQVKDLDFIFGTMAEQPPLFFGKPFAFTFHDLQEKYFPENFSSKTRIKRRLIRRSLVNTASAILCESGNTRDDIMEFYGAAPDKVKIIPLPPTTKVLDYSCQEAVWKSISARYGINTEYILYPAQFWPHKNHIRLLTAYADIVKDFPHISLVLTGSKLNNYQNILRAVSDLSLEKKVIIPGYIDFDDLMYLYRNAKMMVMPSLFESISIPVFEAFSAGVPVCASCLPGVTEQVSDAALLFNPESADDMTECMRSILNDSEFADRLAKKGKARLYQFSQLNSFKQLAAVIEG